MGGEGDEKIIGPIYEEALHNAENGTNCQARKNDRMELNINQKRSPRNITVNVQKKKLRNEANH